MLWDVLRDERGNAVTVSSDDCAARLFTPAQQHAIEHALSVHAEVCADTARRVVTGDGWSDTAWLLRLEPLA